MNNEVASGVRDPRNTLEKYKQNWCWYLLLGLVLMILGVMGAVYSVTVTTIAMLWIGILLIATGIFQFIYAFFARYWQGMVIHFILSLIALAIGIFIIAYPLKASIIFTFFIGCFLILAGLLRILFSFKIRHTAIWWLILLTGLISLILGILILSHWPVSGLWIIRFFISIEVFLNGWSMLIMSIAAKYTK